MSRKTEMIADLDKMIDRIHKDLNRAKRNINELKQVYHDDPEMNTEKLYLLIGELLSYYRDVSEMADKPTMYHTDQTIIWKSYRKAPKE